MTPVRDDSDGPLDAKTEETRIGALGKTAKRRVAASNIKRKWTVAAFLITICLIAFVTHWGTSRIGRPHVKPTIFLRDRPEAQVVLLELRSPLPFSLDAISGPEERSTPPVCRPRKPPATPPLGCSTWCWHIKDDPKVYRAAELASVLKRHAEWLSTSTGPPLPPKGAVYFPHGVDLQNAALERAQLAAAWFPYSTIFGGSWRQSSLTGSFLPGSIIENADFSGTDFGGASLARSDLACTTFRDANFAITRTSEEAQYVADGADLRWCNLWRSDLTNARIGASDLSGAFLQHTQLAGADLTGANLDGVVWEPDSGPAPERIAYARNLRGMTYLQTPQPLRTLRDQLRGAGFKDAAAEVTAVLKWRSTGILEKVIFGFPCDFGASPFRPLGIAALAAVLFGGFYAAWLRAYPRAAYIVIPRNPNQTASGAFREVPLVAPTTVWRALKIGFTLSLFTMVSLGFKEFTPKEWLKLFLVREFDLRPAGKLRPWAGIQAMISVYLLLLSIWCLLDNPFLHD